MIQQTSSLMSSSRKKGSYKPVKRDSNIEAKVVLKVLEFKGMRKDGPRRYYLTSEWMDHNMF